jgi:hypothetical protein
MSSTHPDDDATLTTSHPPRKRTSDEMISTTTTNDDDNNDNNLHDLHDQPGPSSSRRKRPATEQARSKSERIPADQPGPPTEPPTSHAPDQDYGAHYTILLQALEVAVRKGANRWTAKDLKAAYPHLSKNKQGLEVDREKSFQDVWERSAREMREKMLVSRSI